MAEKVNFADIYIEVLYHRATYKSQWYISPALMWVCCKCPCWQNESLDLKQAGTDFCIMHPYEQHGNTRLHIFFMPNIIHINGRLINGCISRVGHIKWVYSVPTGTQTDALRCSNRNKWTHWYNEQENYSTLALSIGMFFEKIQNFTSLRISDHLDKNVRLILNKIYKILVKHVKGPHTRLCTHVFMPCKC